MPRAAAHWFVAIELDHFFILVPAGGIEAERLKVFGLTEGPPNTHPGQGTACRRFFLHNAYLELLWVHNPTEAQSGQTRATRLWERWQRRNKGACPFGFILRSATNQMEGPPFSIWEYYAPYLPKPLTLSVATNCSVLAEPMIFYLSRGQRPDSRPARTPQMLEHAVGVCEITRVSLTVPHAASFSPELEAAAGTGVMQLRSGTDYLVEIGFDGEVQRKKTDFRPTLPLVFCR